MIKNRLRVILAERDMNIRQLAELANVHYTTMHRFAGNGLASIHKQTLNKVCAALKVQPGDLFIYLPDNEG